MTKPWSAFSNSMLGLFRPYPSLCRRVQRAVGVSKRVLPSAMTFWEGEEEQVGLEEVVGPRDDCLIVSDETVSEGSACTCTLRSE